MVRAANVGLAVAALAGCGKLHFDGEVRDADVPLIDGDAFIPDPDACVGCGDLVAYFRFNEGVGNRTVDAIDPANRVATLDTGATWDTGRHGMAVRFDGDESVVTTAIIPALDNIQELTYAAWINPANDGKNGFGVIVSKGGSGSAAARRFLLNRMGLCTAAADCVEISVNKSVDEGGAFSVADFAKTNQWHYMAATYDATGGHLYKDGVEAAYLNPPMPGTGTFDDDSATSYRIGGWGSTTSGAFQGLIDDVRIYKRALASTEMAALYAEAQLDQ